MRIVLRHSKPLLEMIAEPSKHKKISRVQKQEWAAYWATEEYLTCVYQENVDGELVTVVDLDKATVPPPNQTAISLLRGLAYDGDAVFAKKFFDAFKVVKDGAKDRGGRAGRRAASDEGGDEVVMSVAEKKRIEAIRRRMGEST